MLLSGKGFTQTTASLTVNNLQVSQHLTPALFYDNVDGFAGVTVNNVPVVYAAFPWLVGKFNYNYYGFTGIYNSDYTLHYGPVMNLLDYGANSGQWARLWKVSKTEITDHVNNYSQSGYVVPASIAEWPAHGDPSLGQAYYLAPFVDVNQNGHYDPQNGDYPDIRGDEAVYTIFNDQSNNTTGLGLEMHQMIYAFSCSDFEVLNNTIFVHTTFYNRSVHDLTEARCGMFANLDCGFSDDDRSGFDVKTGTAFAYNVDGFDESQNGIQGFGYYPGMIGMSLLNTDYIPANNLDDQLTTDTNLIQTQNGIPYSGLTKGYNDGIVDNEKHGAAFGGYLYEMPVTPADYYRLMNGKFPNGQTFAQYFGIGMDFRFIPPYLGDPENYSTYGYTPANSGWSGSLTSGNAVMDVKVFVSGDEFTLPAGENRSMDVAFVYAGNIDSGNNLGALPAFQNRIQAVQDYFDLNATPCGNQIAGVENEGAAGTDVEIFPNPADDQIKIQFNNQYSGGSIALFTIEGKQMMTQMINNDNEYVNVSSLPNGIYFIRLVTAGHVQEVKKLIIAH